MMTAYCPKCENLQEVREYGPAPDYPVLEGVPGMIVNGTLGCGHAKTFVTVKES